MNENMKCFIVMPITTPEIMLDDYDGDQEHFDHVLDTLFVPAIKSLGLEPIPPRARGSDIIQAEIIRHLSDSELMLCDMSALNPNVFFEFGIRTALNKPVALVVDDKTKDRIPFDSTMINRCEYDSSLKGWTISGEIEKIKTHVQETIDRGLESNALWKYFGISQTGAFRPEDATEKDRFDLLLRKVEVIQAHIMAERREIPILDTWPGGIRSDIVGLVSRSGGRLSIESLSGLLENMADYTPKVIQLALLDLSANGFIDILGPIDGPDTVIKMGIDLRRAGIRKPHRKESLIHFPRDRENEER